MTELEKLRFWNVLVYKENQTQNYDPGFSILHITSFCTKNYNKTHKS